MTSFLFCELLANAVVLCKISIWQSGFDVARSVTISRRDGAMSTIDAGNSSAPAYKLTVCGLVLLPERSNSCRSPINRRKIIGFEHISYNCVCRICVQSASDLTIYAMAIGYQEITSCIHWLTRSRKNIIFGSSKRLFGIRATIARVISILPSLWSPGSIKRILPLSHERSSLCT